MPFDLEDRSDLALFNPAFGVAKQGNCFDKDNKLFCFILEAEGQGVRSAHCYVLICVFWSISSSIAYI